MVTMTVTIKATAPGSGVPTGTVTFFDGSTSLGTSTLNSSGIAKFSTTALSVGSHYDHSLVRWRPQLHRQRDNGCPDPNRQPGRDEDDRRLVSKPVTLRSAGHLHRDGESGGAGERRADEGTVTFYDGTTSLGTAQLYGSGQATISIGTLSVGTHSITASYSGNGSFTASTTATALTQTVNQSATKTSVVSSAKPSSFGQSVTITATVSATGLGSGVPTGSVYFYLDGSTTPLDTAALTAGSASFTTNALAVGSHSITAVYGGDGNFTTSTSAALTQTVKKDATTTIISSILPNPSNPLQVSFTATVTAAAPGSGVPTGNVTFSINGKAQTSAVALAVINGVDEATFTITFSTAGTYAITAVYDGDNNFTKSPTSPAFSQKVT